MLTELTIHEMTVNDLIPCWELDQRCFSDGEAYEMETFRYLLTNPQAVSKKVQLLNGRMIAFVVGAMEPGKAGHVISLGVAPDWRRRGIGRRLMQSIEQSFFDQGARTSRLEVRPDNRVAQRLYENLGYEVTQQVAHYYSNGDDALVMEKRLRPKRSFWSFLFPAKGRENVQAVIMSEDGGRRS